MKLRLRWVLHWLFFAGAALLTMIALFYAEEDWRGARAWGAVKSNLKARGETVSFNDLCPLPVPDDQNLALAPLFKRLFQYQIDPRTQALTFNLGFQWFKSDLFQLVNNMPFRADKSGLSPRVASNWMTGHAVDLSATQQYFRQHPDLPQAPLPQTPADDVLLALSRYAPLLDELARASAERPLTRFPVDWTLRPAWGISLPHYIEIQELTWALRLRAVAELAAGQTPAARRDVAQMLRLRETMVNDPTIIAGLVDSTCIGLLLQPVWEGLAHRQWSADDLDALATGLKVIHMLQEYRLEIRGERAILAARWPVDLQDMAQAREMAKDLPSLTAGEIAPSSLRLERWLWATLPYWPRGWYAQNAALACHLFQEYWIDTVDQAGDRLALAKIKAIEPALKSLPLGPDTLLVKISLAALSSVVTKFAQAQTNVDQAVIACALEKYYLEHHAYPATLAALVPVYLDQVPGDVIDGAPMRYRRTVDGRYQLYSIAWNGKDDGGTIDWPPDRKWRAADSGSPAAKQLPFPTPDRNQGDWVWQYAPAEPPDPPDNQSRLGSL